jgi:hypothetical protein
MMVDHIVVMMMISSVAAGIGGDDFIGNRPAFPNQPPG